MINYFEASFEGNINLKAIIPILVITNVNRPNAAVNNEILSPLAKIEGSTFPIASSESNAEIKPRIDARNPTTSPSKPKSVASFNDFCETGNDLVVFIKPFTIKNRAAIKQIKIRDINSVPPSVKRLAAIVCP